MASAPSTSFCNAPPLHRLAIPTRDPSLALSSYGTLEDMVASCAGGAPPVIQGPGSSMVNRLDEVRGDEASRRRTELEMEAGICMSMGGAGYERGYNGKQGIGGGGGGGGGEGGSWDMGGGGEEDDEVEELLANERQEEYTRGGAGEAEYILERSCRGAGAGEEQGNVIWKKRKLSAEQVRCLERSFELERKLEGQRKVELASQLRLQPRQIAVWFQNRRARWKSKQLEHDYLALKASFASLQAHFDALLAQKQDLLRQVNALKNKLQQGDESLKNNASNNATYERGMQVDNMDKKNEKLGVGDIGATRAISGLEDRKKIRGDKEDMASKDKLSEIGGVNEVLHNLEPSTLSSTEGSVVSEAISSPHGIESVVDSQGELISTSLIKPDVNSSFPMSHPLIQDPPPITLGTLDLFNLNNEYVKLEHIEEDHIDNEQKYCFILEDNGGGAFPWWN